MDLLKEIKEKVSANPSWNGASGIESVLVHIEIAERHHHRAKKERDEHLYTDVIYRTNHAFEGILKEAYLTLAEKPSDRLTPHEIEEYLLTSKVLRSRVVDLLKNYRQQWRNPSTHDHKLFFAEQESFLAIVSVSAFSSILIDQMLEKAAYINKSISLENAALLAREKIQGYSNLRLIDKSCQILSSYAAHYIKNFNTMSVYSRSAANAQMAAFIEKVDPDFSVSREMSFPIAGGEIVFDFVISNGNEQVAVETRDPISEDYSGAYVDSDLAMKQIAWELRSAKLTDGIVFFYPASPDRVAVSTTASTAWPEDLNLREVYGADPREFDDEYDEPVSLVSE